MLCRSLIRCGSLQRQSDIKSTALPLHTVKTYSAVHPLHQFFADTESQTSAATLAGIRAVCLSKLLENPRAKFLRNAWALIANLDQYLIIPEASTQLHHCTWS